MTKSRRQEGVLAAAAPIEIAPRSRPRARPVLKRVQRGFVWLYVLTAVIVAVGVLLQAFSIAAYMRGAGTDALEMHQTGGFVTHSVEIIVFLAALIGYWGSWQQVGLALLLPVIGTIQLLLIGDTDESGSWINGLHGLFAIVVLLLALALAREGRRSLSAASSR
jgi:asparagine N-glycosylation enzyme membrane subunit Stt3